METNLINNAGQISNRAFMANIGVALNGNPVSAEDFPIEVLTKPNTAWAKTVDDIEADFAPDYDREEYTNSALNLMGGYEIRLIMKSLGVSTVDSDVLAKRPLSGNNLLDIGCGPGRITTQMALLGGRVTAFDATEEYVQITAQKLAVAQENYGYQLDASLAVALGEDFTYGSGTYDGITAMFAVINHIESGLDILPQIAEALKPEGKFIFSTYGSNDALVFKLLKEGRLNYSPAILVRRVEGGLQLGESAESILPAIFPSPAEVQEGLENAGLNIKRRVGGLRLASLFPQDPTSDNIAAFLGIVGEIEPDAVGEIDQYMEDPEKLLMATFLYDLRPDQQEKIDDYAYVAYITSKPEDNEK